jgi:hypothetical protein
MNFDATIPNVEMYSSNMRKSMIDKIFFFDKFDADVYVDFGCANGDLIKFMSILFPEKTYIGYDINPAMREKFSQNGLDPAMFFDSFDRVLEELSEKHDGKDVAVICNSTTHEVYNYGNEENIAAFWACINNYAFRYVVIRDMCVSKSVVRPSDALNVLKVRQRMDNKYLSEFESHWGSIDQNWGLVHFLLKYRYFANWNREVRENYLPFYFEDFIRNIVHMDPIFVEHYTLPFLRRQVLNDFDIQLQDRTHVKLIFER